MYALLHAHEHLLPERTRLMLPYMVHGDSPMLTSYATSTEAWQGPCTGNFMADAVKGRDLDRFHPLVQRGLRSTWRSIAHETGIYLRCQGRKRLQDLP